MMDKPESINDQLIEAAKQGHTDTVITLLERGANTETKNNAGLTAAECAREAQQPRINDLLNNWTEQKGLSALIQ